MSSTTGEPGAVRLDASRPKRMAVPRGHLTWRLGMRRSQRQCEIRKRAESPPDTKGTQSGALIHLQTARVRTPRALGYYPVELPLTAASISATSIIAPIARRAILPPAVMASVQHAGPLYESRLSNPSRIIK